MKIASNFGFCIAAIVFLKADMTDANDLECVDDLYMPYPSFPGCNDTLLICLEDQEIMENCCKCRCISMDDPNNESSCYPPPTISSPSSPPSTHDHVNGSSQVTTSPAPSMPTIPETTPPPTNYFQNFQQNGGGTEHDDLFNRFVFIFFALFFPIVFSVVMKKRNQLRTHRRHRRYRAARAERLRRAAMQQEGFVAGGSGGDAERYELIKSKFYFQQVLPDQSNVNPERLKEPNETIIRDGGDVERPSSPKKEDDEEKEKKENIENAASEINESVRSEPSTIDANHQEDAGEESLDRSASSIVNKPSSHSQHHHPSLCEVISSWASVGATPPPPSDVCCICLEGYSVGEVICVAKKPMCDHLFHKDCALEWMKTNDECPLCRLNLLY